MPKATRLQKRIANRGAHAAGPAFVGQVMSRVAEDDEGGKHEIVFLPDKNNPELRAAGRPLHYYFLPQSNRLMRRSDDSYDFGVMRFSGIMESSESIAENAGYSELAGGVMTFTATMAPPPGVVERAFDLVKEDLQLTQDKHYFWKKDTPIVAVPAPVALRSNRTVLHSLNYENSATGESGGDNPDAWAFEIQGDGDGTLNIMATNAFTVMLGRRPLELVWSGAQMGNSPITLENHISYDVWTVPFKLTINGDWERIRRHFSASAGAKYAWFKTSASHEMNRMIENGAITVDIEIGSGMSMEEREKREMAADSVISLIMTMVTDKLSQAGTTLDEQVEAATHEVAEEEVGRKSKFLGFISIADKFRVGAGAAIKNRRDIFEGTFNVTKTIEEQVTRSEVISAQMEGLFDELKAGDEEFDRYFCRLLLEEDSRKIHVVACAIANWPENDKGDPVHAIKVQVGYPDRHGNINWKSQARVLESQSDTEPSETVVPAYWTQENQDARFVFDFTRNSEGDEELERVRVRKVIHFRESPDVALNEVEEEYETDQHTLEVRAESTGQLLIGPITLDMTIPEGEDQIDVIVSIRTPRFGEKKYRFDGSSDAKDHYYKVWYEKYQDIEDYEYQVQATVKGKRFGQQSVSWKSDGWTNGSGSGPLTVSVPAPPDELSETLDDYLS